jgi:hypothetical protein
MATYSLLFIDANEHIGRSKQIECPTDQQAVDRAAKEPGDYRAVQVWDGDRPIALIGNPRSPGEDFCAPVDMWVGRFAPEQNAPSVYAAYWQARSGFVDPAPKLTAASIDPARNSRP